VSKPLKTKGKKGRKSGSWAIIRVGARLTPKLRGTKTETRRGMRVNQTFRGQPKGGES